MKRQLNFKRILLALVLALGLFGPVLSHSSAQAANHTPSTELAVKWCWRCGES